MTEHFINGKRGMTVFKGWTWTTPEERSQRGQHSPTFVFFVRGEKAVVAAELNTGWYPKRSGGDWPVEPYWIVSIHEELSIENGSDTAGSFSDHCDFLEGRACHGYTITLPDLDIIEFAVNGSDYVFEKLEALYERTYGEKP